MINGKKVLAITLARGGSKSVPNKNIKKILGKPLIYYTIKEVLKSKYIDDYIVSTDSKKIGNVAKKYGAKVPFYRPKKISKDNSPPQEALVHGLELYEKISKSKFDYIIEIMCTNPLKNIKDIDSCIKKLHKTQADTVISVQRLYDHHPIRIKKIKKGSIYAIKRSILKKNKSKIGKISRPYIMPDRRSINIDEKIDFLIAELMLKKLKKNAQ